MVAHPAVIFLFVLFVFLRYAACTYVVSRAKVCAAPYCWINSVFERILSYELQHTLMFALYLCYM